MCRICAGFVVGKLNERRRQKIKMSLAGNDICMKKLEAVLNLSCDDLG